MKEMLLIINICEKYNLSHMWARCVSRIKSEGVVSVQWFYEETLVYFNDVKINLTGKSGRKALLNMLLAIEEVEDILNERAIPA